jgi:hypothetical protein
MVKFGMPTTTFEMLMMLRMTKNLEIPTRFEMLKTQKNLTEMPLNEMGYTIYICIK